MFGVGNLELFIVAVVALLLFGNKLPTMMRKLGSGLSEFKHAVDQTREDVRKSVERSDSHQESDSDHE